MASTRYSAINSTGQSVRSATSAGWSSLKVQNVGTVALEVYENATGSGDPAMILAAGSANDDGTGGTYLSTDYNGALWLKAPTGTGRALVSG